MKKNNQKKTIPFFLLFVTFIRSLFIQAVWNFERLLGFGLAYTMLPVIRYLYPVRNKSAEETAAAAVRRRLILREYLGFFNTHPYLAAPIIGVLIAEEEKSREAAGTEREKIENLKIQIMGPLGALGDTFFWATLRPFTALLGVSFVFLFWDKNKFAALVVGLLCFFCLYNLFHLLVRLGGMLKGYRLGLRIVASFKRINLQKFAKVISTLGMITIGAGLIIFSFSCSLFNIGELVNSGYIFNVFANLIIFTVVSLLLANVTPAKIILVLVLLGELFAFIPL